MQNIRIRARINDGILRKQEEELFVFGYSCKLYEDYDKSLYVDQGNHLIPWFGDESLKIDRYDCRGALNDLTPFLPKAEEFKIYGSSNEGKNIELMCDEERYHALVIREDDELQRHEEEMKRLKNSLNIDGSGTYNEVNFSYEDESSSNSPSVPAQIKLEDEEEEDDNFIPPYNLEVPLGMKIVMPKNKKQHEVIEKTAKFISEQGAQMEILLKTKQNGNVQFNFLTMYDDLYPYYRHVLTSIKSGQYKPSELNGSDKNPDGSNSESDSDDGNGTYLHPSLLSASSSISSTLPAQPLSTIPNINFKPSENCLYSALVNNIKKTQIVNQEVAAVTKNNGNDHEERNDDKSEIPNDSLPLSALTKSARRRRIRKEKEKSKAAIASLLTYYSDEPSFESQISSADNSLNGESITQDKSKAEESLKRTSESMVSNIQNVVTLPPPDVQLIIDKMASKVAKIGRDFEEVVKGNNDPRFIFLDKDHLYNPFYNQKVDLYLQLEVLESSRLNKSLPTVPPPAPRISDKKLTVPPAPTISKNSQTKTTKSTPMPISFAIKNSKDSEYSDSKNQPDHIMNESVSPTENDNSPLYDSDLVTSPIESLVLSSTLQKNEMNAEKWAQDRLQAKIVTTAKEKLAAKDKELQAERRKKAAEFINLIKNNSLKKKIDIPQVLPLFDLCKESNGMIKTNDKDDIISIGSESSSGSNSVCTVENTNIDREVSIRRKRSKHKHSRSPPRKRRSISRYYEWRERDESRRRSRSQSSVESYSSRCTKHSSSKDAKKKKSRHHHHHRRHHHRHHEDVSNGGNHKRYHSKSKKSKNSKHYSDRESSNTDSPT